MKTITAFGFNGMNNLVRPPGYLVDDKRRITPRFVLNADVLDGGAVQRRSGYTHINRLANCHSLWAGSVMLCVADNSPAALWRIEGTQATPLAEVSGPSAPLNYEEINNQVFISNPYWAAIYDLQADEIFTWGLPLPGLPETTLIDGDLPPGRYSIAYTRVNGDRIGGNGPIRQVAWEGVTQGIQLHNLGADEVAWITQPNGGKLFLAGVDGMDRITGLPSVRPLESQGIIPPPGFSHFRQAHGRIWGANGHHLYYSEPGRYEWFRRGKYLPFLEDLVMVAPYAGGMYVHSRTSTWCLDGTDPAKMTSKRVGDGAVPGTLTYAPVPAGLAGGAVTSQVFANLSKMPTPVWLSPSGFVVGTHGGNLTNLTSSNVNISVRPQGAALTREVHGLPQIIVSMSGAPVAEDPEITEIRRNSGRLFKS
jgi:hypothetical protein